MFKNVSYCTIYCTSFLFWFGFSVCCLLPKESLPSCYLSMWSHHLSLRFQSLISSFRDILFSSLLFHRKKSCYFLIAKVNQFNWQTFETQHIASKAHNVIPYCSIHSNPHFLNGGGGNRDNWSVSFSVINNNNDSIWLFSVCPNNDALFFLNSKTHIFWRSSLRINRKILLCISCCGFHIFGIEISVCQKIDFFLHFGCVLFETDHTDGWSGTLLKTFSPNQISMRFSFWIHSDAKVKVE